MDPRTLPGIGEPAADVADVAGDPEGLLDRNDPAQGQGGWNSEHAGEGGIPFAEGHVERVRHPAGPL